MARSTAEIQADLDRLNAELAEATSEVGDTIEETEEVIEEAVEAHDEVADEAAEEAVEEAVEAIEEAAEEVVEESPIADTGDETTAERDVAARVVAELEEKYDLTPKAVATVTEEVVEVETTPPQPEHWFYRKLW